MVSSGIKNSEPKIEKLVGILAILAQDRLLSRSPFSIKGLSVLACTGIFPATEKSIQGIEHSWISCRIRRLWICKHVSRKTMRIPYVWRGRGNNADCPLRTESTSLKWFSTDFLIVNSSSRNSCSLLNSFNCWTLPIGVSRSARSRSANSSWSGACSRLDCSYPVRVCPISTAWESFCLQFTNIIFGKIHSVFMSQDLGFCFCEQLFPCLSKKDPDLTSVELLVRFALLWHPVGGLPRTC